MTEPITLSRTALFISHATPDDNHFVRWLGAKLSAMGYEVWADVIRLHGGVDWARELETALRERSVKMLLVCTQSGLDKQGVRNEIEIAAGLARQLGDDSFVIPLRLSDFDPPFRIAQAQYIDFKGGWGRGLVELANLLEEKAIPRNGSDSLETWLDTHAEGAARLLLNRSEPLMSNWLEVRGQPVQIFYCEPPVGSPLERFQHRSSHSWPVVPHRGGVVTFATPDRSGNLGPDLPGKRVSSVSADQFLEEGWPDLGILPHQARNMYSDIGSQAFDLFCRQRGLKGYLGSGNRLNWWGDIKTAPIGQVRFDWGFRRGARQVIGQSEKRGVHWHFAVNVRLRTSPLRHLRIAFRLVFSDNGLDAIDDKRRAHVLRRSLAKGWRNARWRDMLCAYLWWLGEGKAELQLPVAAGNYISVNLPPMQFGCPVSVTESGDEIADEDDPDVPLDEWDNEMPEGEE